MNVVILAGGLGTRISEESHNKPKPMIEIGGIPILVHIMKIYIAQGFNDFIICAGYKQQIIKEYFSNYFLYNNDVNFEFSNEKKIKYYSKNKEEFKVSIIDTGLHSQTGGRVKRIQPFVGNESFMLTYGDGVGDVNLKELLDFHKKSKKLATISCYNFAQSKGIVDLNSDGVVNAFREKSDLDGDLVNIGFMVLEPQVFDYIKDDNTSLEGEPFAHLVREKNLNAFVHKGYWQCMDTLNEKNKLERLYESGNAPWKIWKD